MRIIDAHQHFWNYDAQKQGWINEEMRLIQKDFLPDELKVVMDTNNVESCISVQVDQTKEETLYQLECAKSNSFIKGIVGWIDLLDPVIEDTLSYYKQFKTIKGFRHILQAEENGFMLNPKFISNLNTLSKYDYSYDLLIYHNQLEEAIKLMEGLNEFPIILNHGAKPNIKQKDIADWSKQLKVLSIYKNVSCKISGLVTEANWSNWNEADIFPYLDVIVENFGIDRIMFGSDWPVCLVATSYEKWLNLLKKYFNQFSKNDQEKFFALNCERIYKLENQ
jgi:L-fuconolactonase